MPDSPWGVAQEDGVRTKLLSYLSLGDLFQCIVKHSLMQHHYQSSETSWVHSLKKVLIRLDTEKLKLPQYVPGSIDGGSMLDKSKFLILFTRNLFCRKEKGVTPWKKAVVLIVRIHFNVSEVGESHVSKSENKTKRAKT